MANSPIKYHTWSRSRHLLKTLEELGCDFPVLEAVFKMSYTPPPIELGSPRLVGSVQGGRCMPVWLMLADPKEWRTSWENPWRSSMSEALIELKARAIQGENRVDMGPLAGVHRWQMRDLLDDLEAVWFSRNPDQDFFQDPVYE